MALRELKQVADADFVKRMASIDYSQLEDRRKIDETIFRDNLNLLIANTDRILANPKMAWAMSGVSNGLAISGPFKEAPLGAYLKWYSVEPKLSHSIQGLPIWRLSGSGLSGAHRCKAVNANGVSVDAQLESFHPVFKNFLKTRDEFMASSEKPESALSLAQVVEYLINTPLKDE